MSDLASKRILQDTIGFQIQFQTELDGQWLRLLQHQSEDEIRELRAALVTDGMEFPTRIVRSHYTEWVLDEEQK